jgi:signal transduction histidine kinase/CHASE2 domain-containing sensor protein
MLKMPGARRLAKAVAIGFAVLLTVVFLVMAGAFTGLRNWAADQLFVEQQISDEIVIIAIDDASLSAYGRSPLLWPRTQYVTVVDRLAEAGARVIAFDLLMTEFASGDYLLRRAVLDARARQSSPRFVAAAAGAGAVRSGRSAEGLPLTVYQNALLPVGALREVVDYVGVTTTILDTDGVLRQQPTLARVDDSVFFSFSLATYLAYLRVPPDAADEIMTRQDDSLQIADRRLQIDNYGEWRQNFGARVGEGFPVISVRQLTERRFDAALIRDRIAIIGLYQAEGAIDTYRVPVSPTVEMSGVEIIAHSVQSLIDDTALREVDEGVWLLALLALAMGSSFVYERMRWHLRFVVMALAILVLLFAISLLFTQQRLLFNPLEGVLALLLSALAHTGLGVLRHVREQQATEKRLQVLQQERDLVETIVLQSPVPLLVLDEKGALIRVNETFSTALSDGASLTRGRLLTDQMRELGLADGDVQTLMAHLAAQQAFSAEFNFRQHSYQVLANFLPGIRQWIIVFEDVTTLVELNKLKREMLLMVSHDLRNPLTSLLMGAGYLEKRFADDSDENLKRIIKNVMTTAQTMQYILVDVLDLEQVRSLQMPTEPVALSEAIRDVLARYEVDIETKAQRLTLRIDPDVLPVIGHRAQLTQVVANLVSNAVKYTAEKGEITVCLYMVQPNRVRFEVQDTGYGIPPDALAMLFTEFFRPKNRATSDIPGTGLGLSIVKAVVEKFKGRVWCESTEGKGSTFFVELPAYDESGK